MLYIIQTHPFFYYRSHVLQATDDDECQLWMRAITAGVVAAYSDRSRTLSRGDNSHSSISHSTSLPLLDNQRKVKASRYDL